jgi:succinyl-diaminopimelate desuccinylase
MAKKDEIISIAKELIRFETTGDNFEMLESCTGYITDLLKGYDLTIKKHVCGERPALIITFPYKKFSRVFLNGHIDVVAGAPEQFAPKVAGNKLIGRGAADMKSAIAVYLKLMMDLSLREERPALGLMIVGDEEMGVCQSTNTLLDKGYICEFGICGEPSQLKIGTRAKGAIRYEIEVHGKPSHASRPWEGQNAILRTFYRYRRIQKYFDNTRGWHSTINLTRIRGGETVNMTPESCKVDLDVRFTDMKEMAKINDLIHKTFKEHTEQSMYYPVLNTNKKDRYVQLLKSAWEETRGRRTKFASQYGSSDAVAFAKKAIPAVEFGPKGADWHGKKEYVEINSLVEYYKILKRFSKNI